MGRARVVHLLDCDPTLGVGLSSEERASAAEALMTRIVDLGNGPWRPTMPTTESGPLGYLITNGLLIRRVEVGRGSSVELLGRGDLLRPWQEDASSFCAASWEVLERTTVAVLGRDVTRRLSSWPAVASNLNARGIRRSRALAADAAIASIVGLEERLLLMLWHIAERWGKTRKDGIHLSIHLPHRLLAELVGARRQSVTSALTELERAGRLATTTDGGWVLRGDPPG